MLKIFNRIFFVIITLVATQTYAHKVDLKLMPKTSKLITNHYASTLTANCIIQTKESKNKILVSVVENKGRINGKRLSKGQATSITVHNNQSISVSADAGAQVNLLNLGVDSVNAICYTQS